MVRDIREGPVEEYWDRLREMLGPDGLITYWYLGRAFNQVMDPDTLRLRRDMRNNTGGIMAAPLAIAAPETGGWRDREVIPAPVTYGLHILDDARDVAEIRVARGTVRRGAKMGFSRSLITDAADSSRVIAVTTGVGVTLGDAPPSFRPVDVPPGLPDTAELPPLHVVFGAQRTADGWRLHLPPRLDLGVAAPRPNPRGVRGRRHGTGRRGGRDRHRPGSRLGRPLRQSRPHRPVPSAFGGVGWARRAGGAPLHLGRRGLRRRGGCGRRSGICKRAAVTVSEDDPQTLPHAIRAAASAHPDVPVIFHGGGRSEAVSLADLVHRAARCAAAFRDLGVQPGETVAVQVPSCIDGVIAQAAAVPAGAVLVPVVPSYGPRELGFILRESRARLLVTPDRWGRRDYLADLHRLGDCPDLASVAVIADSVPQRYIDFRQLVNGTEPWSTPTAAAPDDVCLLVYTSGTTGQPKGVQHTHTTLLAELRTRLTGAATDSVILAAFPSGHVAGTLGLLRMLLQGVPHVVMDTWDATTAARLINEHGVTATGGTPFPDDVARSRRRGRPVLPA